MTHDLILPELNCKILNTLQVLGTDALMFIEDELNRGRTLSDIERDIEIEVNTQININSTEKVINHRYYLSIPVIRGTTVIMK